MSTIDYRPCELNDTATCTDCTGEPMTCLVRVTEDAGLYETENET